MLSAWADPLRIGWNILESVADAINTEPPIVIILIVMVGSFLTFGWSLIPPSFETWRAVSVEAARSTGLVTAELPVGDPRIVVRGTLMVGLTSFGQDRSQLEIHDSSLVIRQVGTEEASFPINLLEWAGDVAAGPHEPLVIRLVDIGRLRKRCNGPRATLRVSNADETEIDFTFVAPSLGPLNLVVAAAHAHGVA